MSASQVKAIRIGHLNAAARFCRTWRNIRDGDGATARKPSDDFSIKSAWNTAIRLKADHIHDFSADDPARRSCWLNFRQVWMKRESTTQFHRVVSELLIACGDAASSRARLYASIRVNQTGQQFETLAN